MYAWNIFIQLSESEKNSSLYTVNFPTLWAMTMILLQIHQVFGITFQVKVILWGIRLSSFVSLHRISWVYYTGKIAWYGILYNFVAEMKPSTCSSDNTWFWNNQMWYVPQKKVDLKNESKHISHWCTIFLKHEITFWKNSIMFTQKSFLYI